MYACGLPIKFTVSLFIAYALIVPLAEARNPCPEEVGVQLIRIWPNSYNSCGFPAASIQEKQIAIGDDEVSAGPGSCSSKVCLFDAVTGRRLREWNTMGGKLDDIGERMASLGEMLKRRKFQPMARMEYTALYHGEIHQGSGLKVTLKRGENTAIVIEGSKYERKVYRFKPRIARCEAQPDERVVPQSVYPWALDGVDAIVVGAQYGGAEPLCMWMEWIVIPLKQKAKTQPSVK